MVHAAGKHEGLAAQRIRHIGDQRSSASTHMYPALSASSRQVPKLYIIAATGSYEGFPYTCRRVRARLRRKEPPGQR